MFMLWVKTLSAWDHHWLSWYPRKKLWRAQQHKSRRVSPLTGSVPHKMAEGLQQVSELCANRSHIYYMTRHFSQNWAHFLHAKLSLLDCFSWISRQDKIYQNSRLQTFYWYIFITFDIDWSWNILSLHINLRKVRTEDLKFRTDLPWSTRSSYGCLVSNTVDDYFE